MGDKGINFSVESRTEGAEGLDIKLDYQDTDLATVVLVQYAQVCAFKRILEKQARELGVALDGLD